MYTSLKDLIDKNTVTWTQEEIFDKIDLEQKKHDAMRLMRQKYCELGFDAKVTTMDRELTKERSKIIQLKSLLDTDLQSFKIVDLEDFPYAKFEKSQYGNEHAHVISKDMKWSFYKHNELFYKEMVDARIITCVEVRNYEGDVPESVLDNVLSLQKKYDIKDFKVVVDCNLSELRDLNRRRIDPVFLCSWRCGTDYFYYKYTGNNSSVCKAPITEENYNQWREDADHLKGTKSKREELQAIANINLAKTRDVEMVDGVGQNPVYSEFKLVLGEWY